MEHPACRFRFRPQERLKGRDDIRQVFKHGKSVACYGAKLFVKTNGLAHNRIAFTFARKFGTAVTRNRARRLGREAYRRLGPALTPGYDVVLLLYPHPKGRREDTLAARKKQAETLFTRAGLIRLDLCLDIPDAPRETGSTKQ